MIRLLAVPVLLAAIWPSLAPAEPSDLARLCLDLTNRNNEQYDPDRATELCAKAAEDGDISAQWSLARLYATGSASGGQDPEKSAVWMRKAADGGYAQAQFQLANMLFDGFGTAVDLQGAVTWMQRAATNNYRPAVRDSMAMREAAIPGAQIVQIAKHTGNLYFGEHEYPAAFRWWKRAADLDDPEAQANVGQMLLNGIGAPTQPVLAKGYLEHASRQGNDVAAYALGTMYLQGMGVDKDIDQAKQLLQEAASKHNTAALLTLGDIYHDGIGTPQDPAKAVAMWTDAAKQGDASAELRLAGAYIAGDGTEKDPAQAKRLLLDAAKSGNVDAEMELGEFLQQNEFGKPDQSSAKAWFEKARAAGSPKAALLLGALLLSTRTASGDIDRALSLYLEAARGGESPAFRALAEFYLSPELGRLSEENAYMWANIAVARFPIDASWKDALQLRQSIGSRLDGQTRLRAQLAGLSWLKEAFPDKYIDFSDKPAR